jgi:hypothetical protein
MGISYQAEDIKENICIHVTDTFILKLNWIFMCHLCVYIYLYIDMFHKDLCIYIYINFIHMYIYTQIRA